MFWQGSFLDSGWKRSDDELFVRSKCEHQFSRELIKIFIWSLAVRELCLDARDKFMPFEISNLIVGCFFSPPDFMARAFFYVHKSLPAEMATFPLNVAVGKQCFARGNFFSFVCVTRMVTRLIKAVCRAKCFFPPSWLINFSFEESPTWDNVQDLDRLWAPIAKALWRLFCHLKKDMLSFLGTEWHIVHQLDVGKEH